MDKINNFFKSNIASSVCLLILGLVLLIKPDTVISVIAYIIGAILIVLSISNLIRYFKEKENGMYLGLGIIFLIGAIFVIFKYEMIVSIIPFILGIFVIINSSLKIPYVVELKSMKNDKYIILLISTVLSMLIGLFLIFNPFTSTLTITRIIGIFVTVYSIIDIYQTLLVKKELKKLV